MRWRRSWCYFIVGSENRSFGFGKFPGSFFFRRASSAYCEQIAWYVLASSNINMLFNEDCFTRDFLTHRTARLCGSSQETAVDSVELFADEFFVIIIVAEKSWWRHSQSYRRLERFEDYCATENSEPCGHDFSCSFCRFADYKSFERTSTRS